MIKCVRGFVRFQRAYGWERAVKVFTEKTEQQGDKVVRIINAYPIGDNVFCVLADVDILSNEELIIQGFNALGNHVAMNSLADMMKMRDEKRV